MNMAVTGIGILRLRCHISRAYLTIGRVMHCAIDCDAFVDDKPCEWDANLMCEDVLINRDISVYHVMRSLEYYFVPQLGI